MTGGLAMDWPAVRPTWMESALCAEAVAPDEWFPEKGGSTRLAKRICGRCPVQPECLDYALTHNEKWGVWGGTSERERRHMTRGARHQNDLEEAA